MRISDWSSDVCSSDLDVGGWGWVVWGVAARVAVTNHGHWLVGHLAHNRGPQHWTVDAHGVQAFDVPWAAIPTMGEAWHNNHHAYPGSALIGLHPGQSDRSEERRGGKEGVRTFKSRWSQYH